ncbi:KICSTOR complex protein SZT2 isoform X3 [Ornithorhynchus anatinus]|uniref:KICSTOR complex protein SZT2 isoform X3 n=1 Tax=Ornithorhynchus anatinus TaxID=9258 RepID=UPI0010A896D6|nr:KICSTOR complex protein SZT2 isoform X3 [Ornithorhynchus anatinus]
MAADRPDAEVEEAGHVYLLMRKDYRISRNVRLAWFLSHLHQTVRALPQEELLQSERELVVLSVLPPGWQPDEPVLPRPFLLVPSTRVTFLAWQYRFVIELDLSPSTGIVDDSTGEILFDQVFHALSRCLGGLLQPLRVPGSDVVFQPEIYVTIQAYSSIIGLQSHQVLVQGCLLEPARREAFLQRVYAQLCVFEDKVAAMLQQQYEPQAQVDMSPPSQDRLLDAGDPPGRKVGVSMVTADVGLVSMIRQGVLALQLLPCNSSAGIIVITDGVTSVPDVAVCETLLNQLRGGTVACSFVQVGGVYSYDCSFGHVPNVELMKFIATATFGSYLSTCPEPEPGGPGLTVYHRAFLLYSFQRSGEALNPDYYCGSQHRLFNEHLVSASSNPALALRRKKHTEKEVAADLVSTVSVRLREGYGVREVGLAKGGSQLEVKLVLLWKHNMRIEYAALAPWPLEPAGPGATRGTRVEVTMEGGYDILHDVSCALRQPIRSLYRTHVIRRFWNTLQSINQTDQMLAHLQAFSSVPEHFTLPDSTKSGVPLFYIPPGSSTPVLSLQHSGSDSSHAQFAAYWKPILSMDANSWQRWLHMHRLVLILEHDTPIPKHLHTAGSNGRYSTIQCRISHSALTSLLRDWSSFVLVEGYSYVKLLPSSSSSGRSGGDPDPPPSSFYLVRIISKAPCMVLRLGFPIGTPARARNEIVAGLREEILRLRFPHRVQSKEVTPKVKRKGLGGPGGGSSPSKSPPLLGPQPTLSDRPCLVVLHKPLDKLLIRYEKLPLDYRAPFILTLEAPGPPPPLVSGRSASSSLASLSRYLYHQRWIWTVPTTLVPALPLSSVAQLLSTLAEIRLSEGFHFASSGEGIINMVLELPIQSESLEGASREKHTCLVQYILFPPHSTSTKDSFSTDDDNDPEVEALEGDAELSLVTECWVEPQCGHVASGPESWRHLQGLLYPEIPWALFPRDGACISSMLSFEYLSQLCQNKDWSPPGPEPRGPDVSGSDRVGGPCVQEIPFRFDLMQLLLRCQQIQMFFLLLSREPEGHSPEGLPSPPNEMLLGLLHSCLGQELSDREVPLTSLDHAAFLHQVLQRPHQGPDSQDQDQADGNRAPGSRDNLQTPPVLGAPEPSEDPPPQWRCYARLVSPQHLILTFLPATLSDVQCLVLSGTEQLLQSEAELGQAQLERPGGAAPNEEELETPDGAEAVQSPLPTLSVTPAYDGAQEPARRAPQAWFGRQWSQVEGIEGSRPRCPAYVYSCSLDALREQAVSAQPPRLPRDLVFPCQFPECPSPDAVWLDPKHKDVAHHCALLQEHSQRCYVRGLFRTLQQGLDVSSSDLLMAVDACEELLQEMDITPFLLALRFEGGAPPDPEGGKWPGPPGEVVRDSESSVEAAPGREPKSPRFPRPSGPEVPPSDAGRPSQRGHVDLHRVIQEKFLEISHLHFRTVPSNPHYFFYCPPSIKREDEGSQEPSGRKVSDDLELSEAELAGEEGNVSGCCIATESDPELEVEYRECREYRECQEQPDAGPERPDSESLSDGETVNPDEEDSFSILGGDSPTGPEAPAPDLPPLFLHLTCSVRLQGQHSSVPVCSLPTCLGQVLSCLESPPLGDRVPLQDLSVTLDFFILTLPLEVEVAPPADPQHHRSASESSASFPRSPGQPSSLRSDDDLGPPLPPPGEERHPGLCDLPGPHRQAIETTMSEIGWLLEDEMVGALRRAAGGVDSTSLQRVAVHVYNSPGRPSCLRQALPLSFVFGPERSLARFKEEFRRLHLPGHRLQEDVGSNFFFVTVVDQQLAPHGPLPAPGARGALSGPWAWLTREDGPGGVESEELPSVPDSPRPPAEAAAAGPAGAMVVEVPSPGLLPGGPLRRDFPEDTAPTSEPLQRGARVLFPGSPPSLPKLGAPRAAGSQQPSRGLSRGPSLVSSQGSVDSDQLGYDGGSSSDAESEGPPLALEDLGAPPGSRAPESPGPQPGASSPIHGTPSPRTPPRLKEHPPPQLLPEFWLIIQVLQDRVELYAHARSLSREEEGPGAECRRLQQLLVRKVGEICREVNQRLLLQDLHDSHVCNSLLVAESEEDLWRSEAPFHSRQRALLASDDYAADESCQPRAYLAATMQFVPGHFSCAVVWATVIRVHSRLKMGPNMGVSRAIQALRSVLNAFSVVNRKNMFVYQERATQAVYYLRLSETSCSGKPWDPDAPAPSLALARSQEPICPEESLDFRSVTDGPSPRSSDATRPVGQVDRHIQLLVHGVGQAGPEITEELVRALRRRLDEATLDIITVMLVRNCKLTPADVEFIQPPGSPPSEVLYLALPAPCWAGLPAVACYLRQNLLSFLHTPKYTDSDGQHHFQHPFHTHSSHPDLDIYLYNKPGGQGTGGKGVACIALSFVDEGGAPISLTLWVPPTPPGGPPDLLREDEFESLTSVTRCSVPSDPAAGPGPRLRLDIWEKGHISPLQLAERLRGAVRHGLADAVTELRVLPTPLAIDGSQRKPAAPETQGLGPKGSGPASPGPLPFPATPPPAPPPGEPVTPTSRMGRRSFWDMLSKAESGDPGSPKTTDDIILERPEESRSRRRHKTENVRPAVGQERAAPPDLGAQGQRRRAVQLEEGEVGTLHPLYAQTVQRWMEFKARLGCPSVLGSAAEVVSRFLLPSVLSELSSLITSLAPDTSVRIFQCLPSQEPVTFAPCSLGQLRPPPRPAAEQQLLVLGRSFPQWRNPTQQQAPKAMQRFEPWGAGPGQDTPRQRLLLLRVTDRKLQLLTYNWSADLGAALTRDLGRLVQWQNARGHLVHCLLSQKLGLFHHYGHLDSAGHEDKEPNPFLTPSLEAEALIRSAGPPPSRESGRPGGSARGGPPPASLPQDALPFDEALRDIAAARPSLPLPGPEARPPDPVTHHGNQFLEIKSSERRELERQMKMENLFVTWQQRSAQSNMPISAGELETLKQSSRLVHYCATALLFDPSAARQHGPPEGKRRHRSNDSGSGGSGRERSQSCESGDPPPCPGARAAGTEPWLRELSSAFLLQYVQYLQSMGFILVQLRPPSPPRSSGGGGSRLRALAVLGTEGRGSFSCPKLKADGSPKGSSSQVTTYHLQRALPGGIVLMELTFQGCYLCVKQYALECSRIPMGQSVNSQLSMLFTEECDKVRDLMHVHSFSYDFHLRLVHQHVLGSHMALRQGYHLTSFLRHFLAHHPDGPKFGRNHVYQGTMELPTQLIAAHQLYNYIADHASTYSMKPLRMARPVAAASSGGDGKKGGPGPEQNEYALVSVWNSSGSYQDSDGLRLHDDFDVSLLVCHSAAPFEEQGEAERHVLRLRFFVVLTSQRELFPRLTADMRRFRRPPRPPLEPEPPGGTGRAGGSGEAAGPGPSPRPGPVPTAPLFPPLAAEVAAARELLGRLVQRAGGHCRRDTLWKRLFLLEPAGPDRLRLGGRLALAELEELLSAVHAKSIAEIDPQLDCFLSMTVSWYQSLIKVLLSRFPQSCRHFQSVDSGTQYLVVLNQKFTDCFVLVFLDSQSGKTSLTVVFREPFPVQPQNSESPPPQLVSTYHHLESVINTACFNLWTGLL